jgi:hypothetical protein
MKKQLDGRIFFVLKKILPDPDGISWFGSICFSLLVTRFSRRGRNAIKMKERTSSPLIADEENPDFGFSLCLFVFFQKIEIHPKQKYNGGRSVCW